MAKDRDKRGSKKSVDPAPGRARRTGRLQKALEAALRRESRAAVRLEAAQLEVAVLRVALSEVAGEALPALATEEAAQPELTDQAEPAAASVGAPDAADAPSEAPAPRPVARRRRTTARPAPVAPEPAAGELAAPATIPRRRAVRAPRPPDPGADGTRDR